MRVLYATGPGDVIGTYRQWAMRRDDPLEVSVTYSGQFFAVCHDYGVHAYVLSPCRKPGFLQDGQFVIEHAPIPWGDRGGMLYHLGRLRYGLRLVTTAVRFGARLAIVTTGTHWFVLWLLRLFRIRVVLALHCVLWPKYIRPGLAQRLINRLDSSLFARGCFAIMSLSSDITEQVIAMTKTGGAPIISFLPLYRPAFFSHISPPTCQREPFRVLYAGRIERDKGVFDLLAIAKRITIGGCGDVAFDVCGSGSAMQDLAREAKSAGLEPIFSCHGHCDQSTMRAMYDRSHIVVVPTTTAFLEGFNKVVAEAVLAGRPVVTSAVCPSLCYVREAVVEVRPDSIEEYADAILRLRNDPRLYVQKQRACLSYQEQFYDPEHSWGAALRRVLLAIQHGGDLEAGRRRPLPHQRI